MGKSRNSDRLFWGAPKITADGDCSHEIKRHLLLGRKVMTNLDTILKQRHYLASKGSSSKAMVYPVVMYRCESWTIKKAEHWRIDAFELWCWRRLLRIPWTARIPNQPILKEISPEYSLKGLMLKLKLQNFVHLMQRTNSLENSLMLGKIEGTSIFEGESERNDRGWDGWMASPTWWTWVWVCSGSWWWTGKPGICSPWGRKESDMTEQLHWLTEDELKILPLLAFSNNLNIFMHIKGSMSKLWKSRNALKKSLIPLHTHW